MIFHVRYRPRADTAQAVNFVVCAPCADRALVRAKAEAAKLGLGQGDFCSMRLSSSQSAIIAVFRDSDLFSFPPPQPFT